MDSFHRRDQKVRKQGAEVHQGRSTQVHRRSTQEGASDSSLCIRYSELKNKLTQAEDEWTEACMKVEEMMS